MLILQMNLNFSVTTIFKILCQYSNLNQASNSVPN
jgi:hypothetical protein